MFKTEVILLNFFQKISNKIESKYPKLNNFMLAKVCLLMWSVITIIELTLASKLHMHNKIQFMSVQNFLFTPVVALFGCIGISTQEKILCVSNKHQLRNKRYIRLIAIILFFCAIYQIVLDWGTDFPQIRELQTKILYVSDVFIDLLCYILLGCAIFFTACYPKNIWTKNFNQ